MGGSADSASWQLATHTSTRDRRAAGRVAELHIAGLEDPKPAGSTGPLKPEVVAIFGLGEAGAAIAADLAKAGVEVRGYDPAGVPTPDAVTRVDDPTAAVERADMVMGVTAASDAREAMSQAWVRIDPSMVYADLATAAPRLKKELAAKAAAKDVAFTDVALMAPVPGRGLAVPALASGSGAKRFASLVNDAGGRVEVIGHEAGRASLRKLMRSIVTKGLTALLIESMELAEATNESEWLWHHLTAELTTIDEAYITRMLEGTESHARRRIDEMEAVSELLADLGIDAAMARGTIERLRSVRDNGLPPGITVRSSQIASPH